ncbi:hypothetical protein CLOLEP_00770 [[Clostridium] leptum DSM 753]|uniref:Uncharacterized protein n=1 Tax=[Clostridium] leptum DSM 753 TaxID=428125 RepID=A7VQE0_9FIRM|nr:hypothetical protein CLOLEP_00770 [[Clostridium] leptum DSM 753]
MVSHGNRNKRTRLGKPNLKAMLKKLTHKTARRKL